MRWSATGVVEAAVAERLLSADDEDLTAAARRRVADPCLLPADDAEPDADERVRRARRHPGVAPARAWPGSA